MAITVSVPPLVLEHPSDNPEHYEFIRGQWLKKRSVGRKDHSQLELEIAVLLQPIAKRLGSMALQEWTIVHSDEKFIPDVTFSFPNWQERDGCLVAPRFWSSRPDPKASASRRSSKSASRITTVSARPTAGYWIPKNKPPTSAIVRWMARTAW